MEELFPALVEYLTLSAFDDGTARQTSTLLVFCEDGQWKACLNDREASRSLWAASEDPQSTLEALESMLASGAGQWRSTKPWKGKRK